VTPTFPPFLESTVIWWFELVLEEERDLMPSGNKVINRGLVVRKPPGGAQDEEYLHEQSRPALPVIARSRRLRPGAARAGTSGILVGENTVT
jgi:hypothetical protein